MDAALAREFPVRAYLTILLAVVAVGPLWADDVRVVMREGVPYREVSRMARVPVTRYETRQEQQTQWIERTRTYEQTYTRTLYQPVVQQWHRPQMLAWPDGAPQPTMSSQAVMVTRWIPKQEVVKVPLVERDVRPEVRTVARQERVLGFEEQPIVVAREVAAEYADPSDVPLGRPPAPNNSLPPVSADYLAMNNGRDPYGTGGMWPNGYSALNGTQYNYGYAPASGFPAGGFGNNTPWGGGAPFSGVPRSPVVSSNSWPTNNWTSSGFPSGRRGSLIPRDPSPWGNSQAGQPFRPFGGLGLDLWNKLSAKGTLSDGTSMFPTSPSWGGTSAGGFNSGFAPADPAFPPPASAWSSSYMPSNSYWPDPQVYTPQGGGLWNPPTANPGWMNPNSGNTSGYIPPASRYDGYPNFPTSISNDPLAPPGTRSPMMGSAPMMGLAPTSNPNEVPDAFYP